MNTWPAPDPSKRVPHDPPAEHTPRGWYARREAYVAALTRRP